MKAIYKRRLLKAASIVEKAKDYSQRRLFYGCGAPACVLGHYDEATRGRYIGLKRGGPWFCRAEEHFDLDSDEYLNLFGPSGCNKAKTGKQAAEYIRQFVRRKDHGQRAVDSDTGK